MKKLKCSLKRIIALLVAIALILGNGKFEIKKEVKASEANSSVVNAYYTPSAKEKSEAKAQDKKLNTELKEVKKAKEENDKSSEIDKELKKYRTGNSTTYLLKNGKKKLEIFGDEIRFKDNGEWKNYNPLLKKLDKKDNDTLSEIINKLDINNKYEYSNVSGDTKQYFPSELDDESNVVMSKKDYVIAFSPSNIESLVDLEKSGKSDSEKETAKLDVDSVNAQKIKYKDSGKKIEFSYESLTHGVKEEIVLNDKPQTNIIEFDFKLKGLKIISNKYDRELRIVDCKTDKLVAYISEPFITDNKGETTYENIEYKLKDDKIQLVINSKYLCDRNTSYPITIDPTVFWMGDRLESASVSNFQYSQNYNIKHTDKICLRNKNMQFTPYTDTVEMCYIDTSGIDNNNALTGYTSYFYGSDVSEATLSITEEGNAYMLGGNHPYTFNSGYVDVRTPSSTWNPNTITWNNHPAIGSDVWAQFETTGTAGTIHNVDVTDWAQAVANRAIPNTGLALKMTNEGTGAFFYSASFNNYNPMSLSVVYEDTFAGKRDNHSYENIEMADGTAMVELAKGNLLYKQEDFSLPSPNMNPNVTRIYNSRNIEKGVFGIGWTCEYDAKILDEHAREIVYKDATGAIWEFGLQQGTNWRCNQNTDLSIDKANETKNMVIANYSNGQSGTVSFTSHIRITDKEKITRHFDSDGKLRMIEDANGNFIYIKYHSSYGLIQKIYSKQGQKIAFSYSNDGEDYYINKTTLEDGSSFNYFYNNERLVKVIHEGSNHGEIEYNYAYTNGKLTKVTDAEGEDYNISYCDKSVEEIEKPNGDTLLLYVGYESEKTRVYKKDSNNTVLSQEEYLFDNNGQVIKKTDDAGNETNYTYDGSLQTKAEEKAGYNKLVNNIVQEISSAGENGPVLTEDTSYNARNNVSTETDEEGNVTTYTYGDSDNPDKPTLVETKNPNNETTAKVGYKYNLNGTVKKECDYIENTVTTYEYDSNGNETHSTEMLVDENEINSGNNILETNISDGLEASDSQSQYDSLGNDTSNSTTEGTVSTSEENVYDTDELGRLTSSTDEKNIQTSYEYDEFGRTTTTTVDIPNKPSEVSTAQYDDNGRITSEVDKYGRETTYLYDNMGRVISKTISYDGTSKTTSTSYGYEYNVYIITGKVSNKRYPVVSTITERNENNEVISKKYIEPYGKTVREEEYGIVKDFTYDMQGNVYTTYERGTSSTNVRSPKLTVTLYDKNGKLTDTIHNPIYRNGHFTVDANNSIVESNTYDNAGNLIQEKDSKGNITTYEYNEEGKVTKVSLPDSSANGNETLYAYNIQNFENNQLVSTKDTTTNARGYVSTTTYNGAGQVMSVADEAGSWTIKTSYDYDASGNKSRETHQNGGYITYNYNAKNQLTESKEYNNGDELEKKSTYSYNSDDLVASVVDYKKVSGSQEPYRYTYYGYNDFGKMTSFAEIDASSTPSESTINSHKLKYKYDIEDKLIEIRYPKTSGDSLKGIKLEYNDNKWLTTIKAIIEEDNEEILRNLRTYTYYNDSRVKTINDYRGFLDGSNGYINKTYEYDVFDRVTEMEYKDSSNLNEVLEKHTYSYDKNSNILSEEYINNYPSSQSDRINETRVYTYDSLNRLKTSRVTNNTDNTAKNTSYTYDKVGNITQVIEGNVTTNNSYNGFNQLSQSKVYTNGQFTEQKNYTYDANGNQISEKTMINPPTVTKTVQKEYDTNNQFTKVTYRNGGDNGTITHVQENKYNSSGKRISRIDDGTETRFFYQGDVLLYTTDSNGDKKCQNIVGPQDNVIATIHYDNGEKVFFYNKDIKTSITNVVDDSGDGVVRYSYDDFGETTKSGNTSFYNEICYTGGVYDELTGQYYLNARYYDPENKTFITQDTYRGEQKDYNTWNLYAYCGGNPIYSVDPSGHKCYTICASGLIDYSRDIQEVLRKKYREKKNGSVLKVTDNVQQLKKAWNSITGTVKCMFILSHGTPTSLGNCSKYNNKLIDTAGIKKLKKKKIKKLIITGCNCGHQDYAYKNVAYCFKKKISGNVIAADGTVLGDFENSNAEKYTFTAREDKEWKSYCFGGPYGRRAVSAGWVKYTSSRYVKYSNKKKMTLKGLLAF